MKNYTVYIEEDEEGNAVLPLPEGMLKEVGWNEGDTIEWKDNHDGSFSMVKKEVAEETEWVLVEAVSMFRMRYMVEVPKGKSEWALDTVVMNEAKEFSQEHLDETIVSHWVVTEEEALKICDNDNSYCASWPNEKKIEVFFTKEGEKVNNE